MYRDVYKCIHVEMDNSLLTSCILYNMYLCQCVCVCVSAFSPDQSFNLTHLSRAEDLDARELGGGRRLWWFEMRLFVQQNTPMTVGPIGHPMTVEVGRPWCFWG